MNRHSFTPMDAVLTTNYLGFVYRELIAKGHKSENLLRGTGLTEENLFNPDFRCTFKQHKALTLNTMDETGDPHLGPRTGTVFNPINIGLPASAAMSSDNFSCAIKILQKYLSINFPIVSFDFFIEGEKLVIKWQTAFDVGEIEYFVLGAAVVVFEKMFRLLLNEEQVSDYMEFATPQPSGAKEFSEFLGFPIYFDSPFTRMVLSSRFMNKPLASADPIVHQKALRLCEKQLAESFFDSGLDAQVRNVIAKLNYHNVSLEQVASELGLSERNLRRQLSQAGTPYKKIVDELRESRARELLAIPGLPITEIAYDLGFSDPSNFARTFKRWTGVSPHKFRENVYLSHN